MKDLSINITNKDIELERGDLKFTSSISEYTSQKIEQVFQFFRGEWFLDFEAGIPYIARKNEDRDDPTQNIFVKDPDFSFINSVFRNAINQIETIDQIVRIETEYDNSKREYRANYNIKLKDSSTIEGDTAI